MSSLIDKISGLLPILEARGTVYLFALAEREDIDLWDVVLSSEWSDKDWVAAVRFVADELRPRLEPQELASISRIAVIPSSSPRMEEMPVTMYGVVPEDQKVVYVSLLGSDVRRAFIFKTNQLPAASTDAALVGTIAHS